MIETQGDHALLSVWHSGRHLLSHEDFKPLRKRMVVYSGPPRLFKLAQWVHNHINDVIVDLFADISRIICKDVTIIDADTRREQSMTLLDLQQLLSNVLTACHM